VLGSNDDPPPPAIARIGGHPRIEPAKIHKRSTRANGIFVLRNQKTLISLRFREEPGVRWGALATVAGETD